MVVEWHSKWMVKTWTPFVKRLRRGQGLQSGHVDDNVVWLVFIFWLRFQPLDQSHQKQCQLDLLVVFICMICNRIQTVKIYILYILPLRSEMVNLFVLFIDDYATASSRFV